MLADIGVSFCECIIQQMLKSAACGLHVEMKAMILAAKIKKSKCNFSTEQVLKQTINWLASDTREALSAEKVSLLLDRQYVRRSMRCTPMSDLSGTVWTSPVQITSVHISLRTISPLSDPLGTLPS